jgi:hypothetical protein
MLFNHLSYMRNVFGHLQICRRKRFIKIDESENNEDESNEDVIDESENNEVDHACSSRRLCIKILIIYHKLDLMSSSLVAATISHLRSISLIRALFLS